MRQHGVHIRGDVVYAYGNPARYMIDGTLWMSFGENYPFIPVEMIKRIDIIPAVNTALFGITRTNRSSAGKLRINSWSIIAITTKDGSELPQGGNEGMDRLHMKTVTPQGYQTPVEFYAPKYETARQRNAPERDLRTTLWWTPALDISPQGTARIDASSSTRPTILPTMTSVSKVSCMAAAMKTAPRGTASKANPRSCTAYWNCNRKILNRQGTLSPAGK